MFAAFIKHWFHVVVVKWMSKNVLKVVMHMQTVVLLIKPIVFYPVVVVVASAPH